MMVGAVQYTAIEAQGVFRVSPVSAQQVACSRKSLHCGLTFSGQAGGGGGGLQGLWCLSRSFRAQEESGRGYWHCGQHRQKISKHC